MQGTLITKLYRYMQENNPELIMELEQTGSLTHYLSEKVSGVEADILDLEHQAMPGLEIEEICMAKLIVELKPSRHNYILQVLQDEFETVHSDFADAGILQSEAINIVQHCKSAFDDLVFNEENENNRFLRYAIIGMIKDYLESNSVSETVSNGLQQSAETQGQY